jgi:hypothetical protein
MQSLRDNTQSRIDKQSIKQETQNQDKRMEPPDQTLNCVDQSLC